MHYIEMYPSSFLSFYPIFHNNDDVTVGEVEKVLLFRNFFHNEILSHLCNVYLLRNQKQKNDTTKMLTKLVPLYLTSLL